MMPLLLSSLAAGRSACRQSLFLAHSRLLHTTRHCPAHGKPLMETGSPRLAAKEERRAPSFKKVETSGAGTELLKAIFLAGGLSILLALCYGAYDPAYRPVLRKSFPYVGQLLDWILGERKERTIVEKEESAAKAKNLKESMAKS